MNIAPLEHPYRPVPVDDVLSAYPAHVRHLMPLWSPEIGHAWEARDEAKPWLRFQSEWFYGRLPEDVEFATKAGVDSGAAIRHLAAIQRSFEPKHEAKVYAVSFLAAQWFETVSSQGSVLYRSAG